MNLSIPAKKMIMLVFMITAVFITGGAVLCVTLKSLSTDDIVPVTLGILLSTLVCVIKIYLLEYQVTRLSKMEDAGKARLFGMGHGLLRFVLTGGGLVAAHFIPFTNLIAALVGAFSFNIAAYALRFVKLDEDDTHLVSDQPTDEESTSKNIDNNKNELN